MNNVTRQFLNLILEDNADKNEKNKNDKQAKADSENKESSKEASEESTAERQKLRKDRSTTSNQLSRGRPITDANLSDVRYKIYESSSSAQEILEKFGIKNAPSGEKWYDRINGLIRTARGGYYNALIRTSYGVEDESGSPGVYVELTEQWKDDDKAGKRSFGFVHALIMGAKKAGYLKIGQNSLKRLRIELVENEDAFLVYSGKSQSWNKQ